MDSEDELALVLIIQRIVAGVKDQIHLFQLMIRELIVTQEVLHDATGPSQN